MNHERSRKISDLSPEVASGRFERMLPHFSLGKKAVNQHQASMAKVMEGFCLSNPARFILSICGQNH